MSTVVRPREHDGEHPETHTERRGRLGAITLCIGPEAAPILRRVGASGAYVGRLVVERNSLWIGALAYLHAAGWTVGELCAAMEAMAAFAIPAHAALPASLAAHLEADAAESDLLRRHRVSRPGWSGRCDEVRKSEPLARALWTVSREVYAGNVPCKRAIIRERPKASR